jgi:hypothetical protein
MCSLGLDLLTANGRDFKDVPGLKIVVVKIESHS